MRRHSVFSLAAVLLLVVGCASSEKKPEEGATTQEYEAPAEEPAVRTMLESKLDAVHFDFDKYDLRPDAREVLDRHVVFFRSHPEYSFQIEGHCDERGSVEYNLALGDRRAMAVRDYLESMGVEPGRITIMSYGEERPVDPGHNEFAWSQNRRAEFVLYR